MKTFEVEELKARQRTQHRHLGDMLDAIYREDATELSADPRYRCP